jgi:phosphoesterase RecJ-like protein
VALGLALAKLDKKITMYNPSPIPAVYRFLPGADRILRQIKNADTYELALILDCGDLVRIGENSAEVEKIPVLINLDHHVSNTGFGHIQFIDTSACATAEIVYRLINALQIPFDKAIATSIYTGILTDTGSFRFSNTNQAAFAISKAMTDAGVEPHNVAQHVFGTYSLGRIKLLNLALNSIEISNNGKLSMMTVTRIMLNTTGTNSEDLDGMINYARRIEDVKVAALIHEIKNGAGKFTNMNRYHVSLRSDSSVDVARIAGKFGGGGHTSAAGFQIESTLVALKTKVIDLAEDL